MAELNLLLPGDPTQLFIAPNHKGENFIFGAQGGRFIVLCFFGRLSDPNAPGRKLLEAWREEASLFDGKDRLFIGIGLDPTDGADPLIATLPEGMVVIWDHTRKIGRQFGVTQESELGLNHIYCHYVLDVDMSVAATLPLLKNHEVEGSMIASVKTALLALTPQPDYYAAPAHHAPILIVPHVFEPELCKALIAGYEKNGGRSSGFMRDVGGKTIEVNDPSHKVRADWSIDNDQLIKATKIRIMRRVIPQIAKSYQFQATRIERFIVACYDATAGGHFNAHRDNTTRATSHRRFAVSINLNAEDFEGGNLTFPEFGRVTYRPPTGGAVVFSCSLLHRALPVTKGKRYVFLPFLYDEEAAKIRDANEAAMSRA